jgi:hypothetical protein
MNRKELNSFKQSVYRSLLNERYNHFVPPTGDPVLDDELNNINNNDLPRLPPPIQQNAPKPNYGPGYFHWDISTPNWPRPSDITNPGRLPQYRYPSGMRRFDRFWNPVRFA